MNRRALLFGLASTCLAVPARATWKPEYADLPDEVKLWYNTRKLMPAAARRLNFSDCCSHADRLRTAFTATERRELWWYYPDPECTVKGCRLILIPADTIHDDPIPHSKDSKAEDVFKQMRAEGVLFLYLGNVTCFWPPDGGL